MIYGTYKPPKCRVGSQVYCHLEGEPVKVTGLRDGWPLYRPTKRYDLRDTDVPVLTDELVRAVCEEETRAIMQHWGIKLPLLKRWRAAIAGTQENPTTVIALKKLDPKFRKRFYPPELQPVPMQL